MMFARQRGHRNQFLAAAVQPEGCQIVAVEQCAKVVTDEGARAGAAHKRLAHYIDVDAAVFVCVSAGYRLQPDVTLAGQAADVRAIAWVRAQSAEFGADAGSLLLSGSSAGANLAFRQCATARPAS